MSETSSAALGLSRLLLRVFVVLNLAMGVLLIAGFVGSFVFESVVMRWMRSVDIDARLMLPTVRVWLLLSLPFVAAMHVLLTKTLEILKTVRMGGPFVAQNAARLRTMAWCLLAMQVLHLVNGVMVKISSVAGARMDWSFSLTGWLAVLLLFVLAGVFEEGARLRADLEAMI
jgi:hypothetical protein